MCINLACLYLQEFYCKITTYLCSHYTITPSYCSPAVNLATTPTSVIQKSVNSLCDDDTNMPVVTGGVGGIMGLIILTQIVVIVVLLLRQSAKSKANKR